MAITIKVKTKRKFALLDDVEYINNGEKTQTYIVSTMSHKIEPMYLIAGFGKPIHEQFLKSIKHKTTTP